MFGVLSRTVSCCSGLTWLYGLCGLSVLRLLSLLLLQPTFSLRFLFFGYRNSSSWRRRFRSSRTSPGPSPSPTSPTCSTTRASRAGGPTRSRLPCRQPLDQFLAFSKRTLVLCLSLCAARYRWTFALLFFGRVGCMCGDACC